MIRLACQRSGFDMRSTLNYKVHMKEIERAIAIIELLLILPAALFMTALFVRNIQPAPYEPAQTARHLVEWFSARPILGRDVFLVALPFAALVIGCATVRRTWRGDAELRLVTLETLAAARSQWAALLTAGATLIAGVIMAIVALHMIAD
jgi:hypothetical protein